MQSQNPQPPEGYERLLGLALHQLDNRTREPEAQRALRRDGNPGALRHAMQERLRGAVHESFRSLRNWTFVLRPEQMTTSEGDERLTMTMTAPAREGETTPARAAAGGDAGNQLAHLRGHRAFQRQEEHEQLRIDWSTTITREQSRRHILRDLDAKINLKGGVRPAGRHEDLETSRTMRRTARMVRNREHLSPGDLSGMGWKLRRRILQARHPDLRVRPFQLNIQEEQPLRQMELIRPPEEGFPAEIQRGILRNRRLRELLALRGASPGRARGAALLLMTECPECRQLWPPGTHACPGCGREMNPLEDTVEIMLEIKQAGRRRHADDADQGDRTDGGGRAAGRRPEPGHAEADPPDGGGVPGG